MAKTLSLKLRLLLQTASAIVLVCVLGALLTQTLRQQMLSDRRDQVRSQVESAASLVALHEEEAATGLVPEAEARRRALQELARLRFDGDEYFFVLDRDLKWLAHGMNPKLVGKDMHSVRDPVGTDMGRLFDDTLRQGGGRGFAQYVWDKPGAAGPQPKLAYFSTSARWGWVVGTGLYLDDISAVLWKQVWGVAAQLLLFMAVTLSLGWWVYRSVMRELGAEPSEAAAIVREIAAGKLDRDIRLPKNGGDSLLAHIREMQGQLRRLVGEIIRDAEELGRLNADVVDGARMVADNSQGQSEGAAAMAASVEQLTVSISHIARHAMDAREVSQDSGQLGPVAAEHERNGVQGQGRSAAGRAGRRPDPADPGQREPGGPGGQRHLARAAGTGHRQPGHRPPRRADRPSGFGQRGGRHPGLAQRSAHRRGDRQSALVGGAVPGLSAVAQGLPPVCWRNCASAAASALEATE
ncbi:cache domain-containing protein [Chromobacterium sp. ATCC 53434]|uniref:cache domain-containing protein n=1 Tax=Chromobacterium sp. (strain ATCC 53434 / SC 14030) TaxID=2059672 RepID=UPI001305096E|nr:cache domain-containing protein [Chromobacterium sp. ATCC 53434]